MNTKHAENISNEASIFTTDAHITEGAAAGYPAIDHFRIVAAIMVIAIHTYPLADINATADFIFAKVICRIAVPFFFMATGYFVLPDMDSGRITRFLTKTVLLYLCAIALYLPLNIYTGGFGGLMPMIKAVIIDGTMYHMWYISATITGVLLLWLMKRMHPLATATAVGLLYAIGLFGDSYYGFTYGVPLLRVLYSAIFSISEYTRNGIFFAPIFLFMGHMMAEQRAANIAYGNTRSTFYDSEPRPICDRAVQIIALCASITLLIWEGVTLRANGVQRHDSMYVLLLPCMYFLFALLTSRRGNGSRQLRSLSMLVYIIHPLVIVAIRGAAKFTNLTELLVHNNLIHFLAVTIISFACGILVMRMHTQFKARLRSNPGRVKPDGGHSVTEQHGTARTAASQRAWTEISHENLLHNARLITNILPDGCRLMPALKADAYGHGAVECGKALYDAGVDCFCVASIDEALELRNGGVSGDILILGHTSPDMFPLLRKHGFIQTAVDYAHAIQLSEYGRLRIHVKADTGMHRLGESNPERILAIYRLPNLRIEGMFTHLCVCDSPNHADVDFTRLQLNRFRSLVAWLRKHGVLLGLLHAQSSYGIINYPGEWAFARVGIALFGALDSHCLLHPCPGLRPVLSLKASIASVKRVPAGEGIGYGLSATARRNMRIALLPIGYADGLPRSLSGGRGHVLINGCKAPIVGRICMDQCAVDVTDISGEITEAVLIGRSGREEITAVQLAYMAGTIPNEILSRLGRRLHRSVAERELLPIRSVWKKRQVSKREVSTSGDIPNTLIK